MITWSKLKRREGVLEELNPEISSRRSQTPKNPPVMAHEEGNDFLSEDERPFIKDFYDIQYEMVKVLYNERTTRLQGESSNQQKGNGGDGRKLPPSPPP